MDSEIRNGLFTLLREVNDAETMKDSQLRDCIDELEEALAAVPTVQAAAGDDLDAMLDSVHPRAIIRSVWALRGGGWEARISVPEGPDDDGWYDYTGNQSVGTGPTRMAAIKNAVDKANH